MRAALIAALAAFATSAFAVPTPQDNDAAVDYDSAPDNSTDSTPDFTIEQVDAGLRLLNGPAEVVKTFLKYTNSCPDNVIGAAIALQSGSVSASPESYNMAYLSPVKIGTPAQTLMMDLDTGSSDLWVFSNQLSADARKGHSYYTPSKSTTSKALSGQSWSIHYGDGSGAKGNVYTDKVVIGGVTATNQAIGAAQSVAVSFTENIDNDGLVGLGFDTLNTCLPKKCATFMDTVAPSLKKPLFAAYLKRGAAGKYDFGAINSKHYKGCITYTPVTSKQYWTINTDGYSIGSGAKDSRVDSTVVDTGTSLVYLPETVVAAYWKQVRGATKSNSVGGYIFPCSSKLPDFSIYIGGTKFTIPGSHINYAPYKATQCFGGIQSSEGMGVNVLGDLFINNFYVIFDFESEAADKPSRVGFAKQK